MHTAHFDDLDVHQRLTLFTFAILSTPKGLIADKEAIAEGLFEHLHLVFTTPPEVGAHPLVPLLILADDDDLREDWTLTGILDGAGEIAPILPHDSECSPLIVSPKVLVPRPEQDMNPYTILGSSPYGEDMGDGLRRLVVLGKITPDRAAYFNSEPTLVFLDFDLSEEDAPKFYEIPLDLAQCLGGMLEHIRNKAETVTDADAESEADTEEPAITLIRVVT